MTIHYLKLLKLLNSGQAFHFNQNCNVKKLDGNNRLVCFVGVESVQAGKNFGEKLTAGKTMTTEENTATTLWR